MIAEIICNNLIISLILNIRFYEVEIYSLENLVTVKHYNKHLKFCSKNFSETILRKFLNKKHHSIEILKLILSRKEKIFVYNQEWWEIPEIYVILHQRNINVFRINNLMNKVITTNNLEILKLQIINYYIFTVAYLQNIDNFYISNFSNKIVEYLYSIFCINNNNYNNIAIRLLPSIKNFMKILSLAIETTLKDNDLVSYIIDLISVCNKVSERMIIVYAVHQKMLKNPYLKRYLIFLDRMMSFGNLINLKHGTRDWKFFSRMAKFLKINREKITKELIRYCKKGNILPHGIVKYYIRFKNLSSFINLLNNKLTVEKFMDIYLTNESKRQYTNFLIN